MLLFLLLVASLSDVAEGDKPTVDVKDCPIKLFGKTYDKITFTLGNINVLELKYPSDTISFSSETATDSVVLKKNAVLPQNMKDELVKHSFPDAPTCSFKIEFKTKRHTVVSVYYAQISSFSVAFLEGKFTVKPPKQSFVRVKANHRLQFSLNSQKGPVPKAVFVELTACQDSYGFMNKLSPKDLKEKCSVFKGCLPDGKFDLKSRCDPSEVCDGKGSCEASGPSCSVLASSVTDIKDHVRYIEDRCSYELLTNDKLLLVARFDFNEDTGTPVLVSLDLTVDQTKVELRSGRVTVSGDSVNLSSLPQVIGDVELFINQNGINVKINVSNGALKIVYNDRTANIEAPGGENNGGLCSGDSTVKSHRRMDLSEASCRQDFDDKPEKPTDCSKEEKLCGKMFTKDSCGIINKVCSKLLCKYGNKNGLLCQMETLCNLRNGLNLNNTDCVRPSACLSRPCAAHEFCALKDGEPECQCRASFLYQFLESGRYGEQTDCEDDTASVQLPMCLVAYRGFEQSQLHLLNKECKGQMDDVTHMLTFKFNYTENCGAQISNNDSHIIYTNTVTSSDDESAVITRVDNVQVNFSCFVKHPKSRVMFIEIEDNSMAYEFTMGRFPYVLVQKACNDFRCLVPVKPGDKQRLGKDVFFYYYVVNLHPSVALLIESCVGSIHLKKKTELQHKIITNGCADPGDKTVRVMENGDGETAIFCLKAFMFKGHPEKVIMKCKVRLCPKEGNNHCHPKCGKRGSAPGARHRRSVAGDGTEIVTSMSWTYQGSDD